MRVSSCQKKEILLILSLTLLALCFGSQGSINANTRAVVENDSIKRRNSLELILKDLPPDNISNGRVSFLDETFTDWLKRTGELPPDFDKMPSIPLLPDPLILDEGIQDIPVTTINQWHTKRDWMREQLTRYITGTFPLESNNITYKILHKKTDGKVSIHSVLLSFGPQSKAKLTLELMIPPGKGPFPVFLTNWNHRQWAQIAVRRGYIGCLYAGSDDKDDTEAYSEIWADKYDFTRLMRRAYGASRAVDYLYTLSYVDKDKIGITGHSRNGKTALMAAAFDERIKACIPSSGGTGAEVPWRYNTYKYDVEDIALLSCAQPAWLHPRLRFFIGKEYKLPVDQNSFMALVSPRGLMLTTARSESASNIFGIEQAYHSAKKVYRFLDAENNLAITSRYGLHSVNAKDIEGYVDFFDYVFERNDRRPENRLFHNYTFEKWLDISKEKIDPINFPLMGGRTVHEKNNPITLKEWENEKQTIGKNITWLLGNEPAGVTNPGPQSLNKGGAGERLFGSLLQRPTATDSMKIMAITPYDGFGDNLFGYLYYPVNKEISIKNKRLPVVIYLHEYDYSKGFSTIGRDHEIESLFRTLTKKGFGVFAFDMIGFGNRLEEGFHFYDRYPSWSKMGKMVADVKGAVDAISNLDFVDDSRIFIAGYSLGGTVGILSTALDKRIAGLVSVAGFTPMRMNKPDRGTEGIRSFSHLHGIIPRLGFFVGYEDQIPVDFSEMLSTIAPRPILIIAPTRDQDAFVDDIKSDVKKVEYIYDLYNAKTNIRTFYPDDYNRFSAIMREKMCKWLSEK